MLPFWIVVGEGKKYQFVRLTEDMKVWGDFFNCGY